MNTCWLCGRPVEDPPVVIGHYRAVDRRMAHRRCMQVLGEAELDLRADGDTDPGPVSRQAPGRS